MPIEFKSCVLFVEDIARANSFYQTILEQEIEFDFGRNIGYKSGVAIWKIADSHEINKAYNSSSKVTKHELYFEFEDINTFREKLIANNIKLLHDIKTEPWEQRTIRFFDPDNHLIEVGEPLKTFITRVYKETTSIEETAKRTGTPVEMVEDLVK